jgi:hypothetical protein
MKRTTGLAVFGASMLAAAAALAADPPDLVGTWKSTGDHAAIVMGESTEHVPEFKTPTFRSPADAWTIVIKEQQGRAFHGVAQAPGGTEETIVGVVSADGEHLIMAGEEAGVFGEVLGDTIEFCFQDHDDDRAAVACFVAAKE